MLTLGLFAALAFLPSSWAAYTLRVYRQHLSGAVSVLLLQVWRAWRCARCSRRKAALAVAGRGGRGSGLRLSGPRGRRAVPAAVRRGGHCHCGRGAGGQAPLEGSGRAGHPVCHARRRRAHLLHPQLHTLRRVCAVRLFGRLLCRGHGRDDARGHRQHRALPLRAR